MANNANLTLNGTETELPVTVGSEGEIGIDISKLRQQTGAITLDPSFANAGASSATSNSRSCSANIPSTATVVATTGWPCAMLILTLPLTPAP